MELEAELLEHTKSRAKSVEGQFKTLFLYNKCVEELKKAELKNKENVEPANSQISLLPTPPSSARWISGLGGNVQAARANHIWLKPSGKASRVRKDEDMLSKMMHKVSIRDRKSDSKRHLGQLKQALNMAKKLNRMRTTGQFDEFVPAAVNASLECLDYFKRIIKKVEVDLGVDMEEGNEDIESPIDLFGRLGTIDESAEMEEEK